MRHTRSALVALLFAVSCVRAPARFTQAQPRDVLYSGMVGRWSGSHVSAGPGSSANTVTPTELVVVPAPDHDGLELRYQHRAGTRTAQSHLGHWHFARALDAAEWGTVADTDPQSFRVIERAGGRDGAPLQLVLETDGVEASQPARIRQVIDVSTGTLRIRKEVQVGGGDFMFREAYVFRRAE